jgi:glutamyl-tRNA(Gln) amidotransferase subunit E
MMTKTINNEIERQQFILKSGKRIHGEVRNALADGTTEFLRPMPGADRMYPETDLPLLKISKDLINEARKTLPRLREDIEEDLKKIGLNEEMIKLLFKQNKIEEFKEMLEIFNEPSLVSKILLVYPKEIASHKKKSVEEILEILNKDIMIFIVESLKKKKISREQVKNVLERISDGEEPEKAIELKKHEGNIEEEVMNIIKSKPGLSENAYMGLVMKELKGKINGKEAMEIIRKLVK